MDNKSFVNIHKIFEQQTDNTPQNKAVVCGNDFYTYQELNQKSNQLAHHLINNGLNINERVAICVDRSLSLIVSLLAVQKAGGCYVPLDPEYPSERLNYMLSDSESRFLLCQESLSDKFNISKGTKNCEIIFIDRSSSIFNSKFLSNPSLDIDKNTFIYLIYTSGSTGNPKGSLVLHKGVANLLNWYCSEFEFGTKIRLLVFTSVSFDLTQKNIYAPLITGGCLYLLETKNYDINKILKTIEEQSISSINCTPSAFYELASDRSSSKFHMLTSLKYVILGGEPILVQRFWDWLQSEYCQAKIINSYGPTECSDVVSFYELKNFKYYLKNSVPIGQPINNTKLFIMDNELQVLPPGEEGELCISGFGVGGGYLNRPEYTAERFCPIPNDINTIVYRTGDRARLMDNGNLEYLGRMDQQVKIRGFRIEVGEIEAVLEGIPAIREAVVLAKPDSLGDNRLVAYLVRSKGFLNPNISEIRAQLQQSLPDFMLPSAWVDLEKLPLSPNGKLDRNALPEPETNRPELSKNYLPAKTSVEKMLTECWGTILNLGTVGINDHFFELGGNSLGALRLAALIEKKFSVELNSTFVFELPTIKNQANYFKHNQTTQKDNDQTAIVHNVLNEFAIIGMSCRLPGAKNVEGYWQNLIDGKETISFFKESHLSDEINPADIKNPNYVKAKGVVEDSDQFDAAFFGISPIEAKIMDPQQRLLLEMSWHALEDAAIPPGDDKWRTGVFVGADWPRYYQQYVLTNSDLLQKFGEFNSALANESDFLSTRISYKLDLKGPSISIATACSTGLVAIAQACEAIDQGQCEQAIAGGISIRTPVKSGYLYQEGSMLSKDGHCRPFDADATGTTFNDGAGVVIIKRKDLALQDGDRIYAIIKGYAVNNDGEQKASFTAPSVGGQVAVYDAALMRAGIDPQSIGFIETHGTATPLGDPIEVLALRKSYAKSNSKEKSCALGSVKSNIGHVVSGAGIASLIKATLALKHNKIPPTLFFQKPNPKLQLDETPFFINSSVIPWPTPSPRRAAVTSLGVGGTNAHVILEEYTQQEALQCQRIDNTNHNKTWPLLISAKNKAALDRQINNYHQFLIDGGNETSAIDASYTSIIGRKNFPFRCAISGKIVKDWADQLADPVSLPTAKAFDFSEKKIGFMFSGQGAQRVFMGKWLYDNNENFRTLFDNGCDIIKSKEKFDLRELLFADPEKKESILAVNQTKVAQPALFLIEYGLAKYLIDNGCNPDFLIGHSIGEFTAAALAGVFTFEDAVALVARRGALMQSMPSGKMLAVRSPVDKIKEFIGDGISIAAINAPGLTVLSGPETSIVNVENQLKAVKISATTLQTSHAFHSHMMDPIIEEFTNFVASMKMADPTIPIYSTMTGQLLSSEEATAPTYWANQLRQPVKFSEAVLSATENNADNALAFIEVGPGNTLSSLVNYHSLPDNVISQSTLPGSGIDEKALSEIDHCIGTLWCKGFQIDWLSRFTDQQPAKISLPGYAFAPDRHWLAPPAKQTTLTATPNTNQPHQQMTQPPQEVAMNPADHLNEIKDQLKSLLEDVTGYDLSEMMDDTEFSEVGLDSLLLTQIATAIDRKFVVGITFRHLVEDYTCLKDLSGFIADKVPVAVKPVAASTAPVEPTGLTIMTNAMLPMTTTAASGSAVQDLIQQQLQIMQLQLQMLSGGAIQTVTETAKAADNRMGQTAADKVSSSDNPPIEPPAGKQTPGTRISKVAKEAPLSTAQRTWINEVMELYQNKFKSSKALAQKHRKHLADPRTVSGFNPEWKEIIFPIVTDRSKGSKLWDIDGNELIDTSNGFGPIFFGHSPDFVTHAVKEQIDKGIETGPQSPLAGEVAELFCELTGNERCTFACTGSEAVIGALRLARTVTGRNKIIMFEGGYHGIHDEVLTRPGKNYHALPAAPGVPREATSNMIVLPWGNKESLDIINQHGSDLAAVLVESVQSRMPEFHDADYIREIRRITTDLGAALILDEVVTGFRVHPGGIQKLFNIEADLATYGKVLGGGYPIGIIAGKAKFMDALDGGYWQYGDSSIPECGVTFFAGTFVRHPLSLAAAKAVLNKIKSEGMPLYDKLNSKTAAMALEAKNFIKLMQSEVKFEEFCSLFYITVPHSAHWGHLLFTLMTLDGIHTQQYRANFLTTEHNAADIKKILSAFKNALSRLVAHGLIPGEPIAAKKFLSENPEIPPGARLGKNAEGQPAYFIEDPENKGQFIEVGKP